MGRTCAADMRATRSTALIMATAVVESITRVVTLLLLLLLLFSMNPRCSLAHIMIVLAQVAHAPIVQSTLSTFTPPSNIK